MDVVEIEVVGDKVRPTSLLAGISLHDATTPPILSRPCFKLASLRGQILVQKLRFYACGHIYM